MFKAALKALLARTPYRIVQTRGANRFEGIADALRQLAVRDFAPAHVIDCGAHAGHFALMAQRAFPNARLHLIEPQPACQPALQALAQREGFSLHAVALGSPKDAQAGSIPFAATDTPNTGAHVVAEGAGPEPQVMVPVATLDGLFDAALAIADRTFLKMDLQGYELAALRGATAILPRIEVVLLEMSFYEVLSFEPTIAELVDFFDKAGFELYDIASLHGRGRDNRATQGDFMFVRKDAPLAADKRLP